MRICKRRRRRLLHVPKVLPRPLVPAEDGVEGSGLYCVEELELSELWAAAGRERGRSQYARRPLSGAE